MQHGRVSVFHEEGMTGDPADHIEYEDEEQDIFQSAEPIVADHAEKVVERFPCDQKSGQRADREKQIDHRDGDPEKRGMNRR